MANDVQEIINKNKREKLNLSKVPKVNKINHDGSAGGAHRAIVENMCETLKMLRLDFYTRVEFLSGNIADIYAPLLDLVIEVTDSETDERLHAKDFKGSKVMALKCGVTKIEPDIAEQLKEARKENEDLKRRIHKANSLIKSIKETLEEGI